MGRVNNTIDKFGRQGTNVQVQVLRGSPGVGFKLTHDGQYDIEGKSLSNVENPIKSDDAATIPKSLIELHIKLLRKIKKSVHPERWEKSIVKFGHTFSCKDAWEIERFGYKNAKLSSKVRILKELLEVQFDLNARFKSKINKLGSGELRSQPLGRDKFGHIYWFQSDDNYQIRVFKEDLDDEKWTLVARDRAGLVSLITSLSDGDIKISSDSAGNEDSNSLSEKPIIDTGQQDTDSKKASDDDDSNLERRNQNKDDEKIKPVLKIKNLSDLMPSPKRPRAEEDEETVFQKYKIKNLEIRVSKIEKKGPVVGEEIEEPVMRIDGEGLGKDNESPIVGEAIEEDVMYIYGNGSGHDCNTGNPEDEKAESEETKGSSGEIRNIQEHIPKQQSHGTTTEIDESSRSKGINSASATVVKSPKMDEDSIINHIDDDQEIGKIEKNYLDNKTVNFDESKVSEETALETKTTNSEITDLLEPNEKLQGSQKETDSIDKSLRDYNCKDNIESNNSVECKGSENRVMEPICIKRFAYVCGRDKEGEGNNLVKQNDSSIATVAAIKKREAIITDKAEDIDVSKSNESVTKTKTAITSKLAEAGETTESIIITGTIKATKTDKAADDGKFKSNDKSTENLLKMDLKKNGEGNSLDSHDLKTDQCPISNPLSVETENVEKPQSKTDSNRCTLDTKINSDSDGKEGEAQPEVVLVSGRTRDKKHAAETTEKLDRPIKKAAKGGIKEKTHSLDNYKTGEKSKVHSAESSIPNSPAVSLGDNSVISVGEITAGDSFDVEAPEADPLAVSDAEGEPKSAATGATVSSFSLDFNESPQPIKVPIVPSPMRAVRKRGREDTLLKTTEADNGPGKRMKLKGRRQVDTALRKSVEQRIEQLHGSSSDSKDSESEQNSATKKKQSRLKKCPSKQGKKKQDAEDSEVKSKKSIQIKRNPAKKNSRILAGLNIYQESSNDRPVLRQSRRLAQLKIKEQVSPASKPVLKEEATKKKSKYGNKLDKPEKRKRDKKAKGEVSEPETVTDTKKKKKKEKPLSRMFNEKKPWQSSSEDSEDVAEEKMRYSQKLQEIGATEVDLNTAVEKYQADKEEEEEEIIDEDDAPLGELKSDHEFSPESDLEDDDGEYQPMKRARTAKKESDEEEVDEFPCQKCGKEDHPEWILLCDKCDNGWHCSCLRPPLLVIPEGDWFCPPCQHVILLEQLQAKLVEYDKKLSKKEVEDRRKERLAYVGISLNNVLPSKEHIEHRKKKRRHSANGSSSRSSETEGSESESESDSDEPIYQLRQRRQTKNYKFNEYDEMIKTAIGEDANKPEDTAGNLGRGKDIQTIVKGLEPEPEAKKGEEDQDRPSVTNLKKMLRKKHRKLNSLEFDSEEEDISDEDFKGSSDESEEDEDEEPDETDDSDDYMGRKRRKNLPTRRSTRTRTRRYDTDFINDDDSEDKAPRKKKKKSIWDDSDTEDSDLSGYGPKEKRNNKKKKKNKNDSDDEPTTKKNRPRIKYGGLTSSEEEELGKGRRTRGKKTTYVDTLGSDSEEEAQTKKNPRKIVSDDDEDFVANEEDEAEDEEKDSEDKEDQIEQAEYEVDSEQERREKRSLLVPKIYIKKPLGEKKQKELEAAKAKAVVNVESESTINKPEEKPAEESVAVKIKDKESKPKDEKKGQNTENSESVKYQISIEKNKNVEIEKPKAAEESEKKEAKTVEATIKKEAEDVEEKTEITESKQSNPELSMFDSSVSLVKVPGKRGRKPKLIHEPIVSNVNALFKNDDENDDLSEPPGISLPLFDDLASNSINSTESTSPETAKKRRDRGPGKKKSLEETLSSIGTRITTTKTSEPAIEIAAPPQPFSQAQPTPSVITRMLQSKPGITIYPVGRIRPKQFATMRDDDSDEASPKNSPLPSATPPMSGPPNQYNILGGPRGPPPMAGPYRPQGPPHPGMNHYPRGPPGFRGPPPPQGMLPHPYSHHPSHRPMDPSPSGGGPINLTDPGPGPPPTSCPMGGPDRKSPGVRGTPVSRYSPVGQTPAGPIMNASRPQMQQQPQQPYSQPSTSSNGPPPSQQAYPPPTSVNASSPQQSYPPRPSSGNNPPPPQQPYHLPPNSSGGKPQQTYNPSPTSSSGPPPQQAYSRPPLSNGPQPQPIYPAPPTSNNGPPPQQPYPPRPSSNNGPPLPQQSYSPRPTASNSGPPSSQPPEGYYGNYPPPTTEEPMPTTYQSIPPDTSSSYPEQYSGEDPTPVIPPSSGSHSKAYEEESGGEFAGLASYFSSQRDDDLES